MTSRTSDKWPFKHSLQCLNKQKSLYLDENKIVSMSRVEELKETGNMTYNSYYNIIGTKPMMKALISMIDDIDNGKIDKINLVILRDAAETIIRTGVKTPPLKAARIINVKQLDIKTDAKAQTDLHNSSNFSTKLSASQNSRDTSSKSINPYSSIVSKVLEFIKEDHDDGYFNIITLNINSPTKSHIISNHNIKILVPKMLSDSMREKLKNRGIPEDIEPSELLSYIEDLIIEKLPHLGDSKMIEKEVMVSHNFKVKLMDSSLIKDRNRSLVTHNISSSKLEKVPISRQDAGVYRVNTQANNSNNNVVRGDRLSLSDRSDATTQRDDDITFATNSIKRDVIQRVTKEVNRKEENDSTNNTASVSINRANAIIMNSNYEEEDEDDNNTTTTFTSTNQELLTNIPDHLFINPKRASKARKTIANKHHSNESDDSESDDGIISINEVHDINYEELENMIYDETNINDINEYNVDEDALLYETQLRITEEDADEEEESYDE